MLNILGDLDGYKYPVVLCWDLVPRAAKLPKTVQHYHSDDDAKEQQLRTTPRKFVDLKLLECIWKFS